MKRIAKVVMILALFGVIVPVDAGAQLPPTNDVQVVGFEYIPRATVVEAGERVTWTNIEPAPIPHTVSVQAYVTPSGEVGPSPGLVCGTFNPGQSCSRGTGSGTSLPAGTYLYVCVVNPAHTATMQGLLEVL